MFLHSKKLFLGAAVICLLSLTACGESASDKAYTHLEKAVELEEGFEAQQEPIMNLEEQEQQLYEDMLSLGTEEMDEIEKLAEKAKDLAEERKGKLEKEKESIEAAYEEYKTAEEEMSRVEGAESEAESLQEAMNNRYNAYQSLYESYQEAITQDISLYEAFTNEDLTIEELQNQIDQVNEQYSKVIENRDTFNEYTDEYNKAKENFYEASELEIDTGETEEVEESN
ncbi:YkyA family protein [Salibacterium aidingense]|uniref:YkyA family protein n=1 Tax=Salibacterium aidingense TaxID=384933 RepID=UPI0004098795|nr:YkyA family protein [Salibacterium aidingense]